MQRGQFCIFTNLQKNYSQCYLEVVNTNFHCRLVSSYLVYTVCVIFFSFIVCYCHFYSCLWHVSGIALRLLFSNKQKKHNSTQSIVECFVKFIIIIIIIISLLRTHVRRTCLHSKYITMKHTRVILCYTIESYIG